MFVAFPLHLVDIINRKPCTQHRKLIAFIYLSYFATLHRISRKCFIEM